MKKFSYRFFAFVLHNIHYIWIKKSPGNPMETKNINKTSIFLSIGSKRHPMTGNKKRNIRVWKGAAK